MSRDFILVFSGGLVSLMTTLVVLFVMDYYYRRLDRERGASPTKTDKPASQPVAPLTAKPVEQPTMAKAQGFEPQPIVPAASTSVQTPKPVATQPTQVDTPKPVTPVQPTQVESPKPVAPAPKPEPKPLPTYKPSGDSLLPPQLRKSVTPDKPVELPKPAPQVAAPVVQAKEEPKPQAQEKESPKEESKNNPPDASPLPPETMKK